jgi:hypothetical protein
MILRSAKIASSSATYGQTASNLPTACGAEEVTYTRCARKRKYIFHTNMLQLSVGGRRKPPSPQLSGLRTREVVDAEKVVAEAHRTTTGRVFSSNLTTPDMSFVEALRGKTEEQQQPQTDQVNGPAPMESRIPAFLPQNKQ